MFKDLSLSLLSFKIDFISFFILNFKRENIPNNQHITIHLFYFSLSKSILSLSLFSISKERILFLKPIFCPSVFTFYFYYSISNHIKTGNRKVTNLMDSLKALASYLTTNYLYPPSSLLIIMYHF